MQNRNRLSKILLLSTLFVLALAGCQSAENKEGPADAYWMYYQACEDGNYGSAKLYLTEAAKAQNQTIGFCGFTHDAINRVQGGSAGAERTFNDDPLIDANENNAILTWIDEQGNLAIVHLIKDAEGWKVTHTIWSN
jgi:hypothetical protein